MRLVRTAKLIDLVPAMSPVHRDVSATRSICIGSLCNQLAFPIGIDKTHTCGAAVTICRHYQFRGIGCADLSYAAKENE